MYGKIRLSRSIIYLVAVCAVILSGCAMFRSGEFENVQPWPLSPTTGKKSIAILLKGSAEMGGYHQEVQPELIKYWMNYTSTAYQKSELFSRVVEVPLGETDSGDTNYLVEVKILEKSNESDTVTVIKGVLTGLTMTIIPTNVRAEYILETVIKDKNRQALGEIKKSEGYSFWVQLFLVFGMPFNKPLTVVPQVITDINRATIVEAHSRGYF